MKDELTLCYLLCTHSSLIKLIFLLCIKHTIKMGASVNEHYKYYAISKTKDALFIQEGLLHCLLQNFKTVSKTFLKIYNAHREGYLPTQRLT